MLIILYDMRLTGCKYGKKFSLPYKATETINLIKLPTLFLIFSYAIV